MDNADDNGIVRCPDCGTIVEARSAGGDALVFARHDTEYCRKELVRLVRTMRTLYENTATEVGRLQRDNYNLRKANDALEYEKLLREQV